jgi:hypothetical protein
MDVGAIAIREESDRDFYFEQREISASVRMDGNVGPFRQVSRPTNTRPNETDALPAIFS